MSYDMNKGGSVLQGTIHRSDDDGKTWRIISTIRRRVRTCLRLPVAFATQTGRSRGRQAGKSGHSNQSPTEHLVMSIDGHGNLSVSDNTEAAWKGIDTDEGDLGRLSNGRLVLVVRPDGGVLVSDDDDIHWNEIAKVGPSCVYAPHLVVLKDDTLVLTAGGGGGQCAFLSTDGGRNWSSPIKIDPGVYGYGKLTLMEDETILLGYVMSGSTPNRCYLLHFRVNEARDGVELLPLGE